MLTFLDDRKGLKVAEFNDSLAIDVDVLQRQYDELGFGIAVELRGGTLVLSGEVDSENDRQAVLDLAQVFAESTTMPIDENIEVAEPLPETTFAYFEEKEALDELDAIEAIRQDGLDPADDQQMIGTTNSMLSAEEGIPYFPPTDPVVEPSGDDEELAVVGGFSPDSYDRSEDLRPGQTLGDEQITDLVRRELREDSVTTDFDIDVETRNGVVFLRGSVETLDDAENVEAVAGRVAGVVDVREELEVISLKNPRLE